ncbi:MAG: ATP-dependent DNA helicase [Spirochaetes bacterium]|nr:ATP-dependent DNA helicase [Spirochaetota bacterium]
MKEFFGKEGWLKDFIPGFEFRDDQLRMSEFVLDSVVDLKNCIVEAGTGIGKTLAYLIPVVQYAVANQKKVHISTETKALQKQLVEKDIPIVEGILKKSGCRDFRHSLCLGSSNYPCRRRFEALMSRGRYRAEDSGFMGILKERFDSDLVFTRFDVRVPGRVWGEICRESDACGHQRCFFSRRCPYLLARKEWADSDVLIMNHHLFFTNIASGRSYLPAGDIAVFDEAHSVGEIASSQMGFTAGYFDLLELMRIMTGSSKRRGLADLIPETQKAGQVKKLCGKIITESGKFFEGLRSRLGGESYYTRIRDADGRGTAIVGLVKDLMVILAGVDDLGDAEEHARMEFDIIRGRIFLFQEALGSFVHRTCEGWVYWIERDKNDILGDVVLKGQPVDVSVPMRESVYSSYDSCAFVSATITVEKDFSFFASNLGLDSYRSISIDSTFSFRDQVVLYIDGASALQENPQNTERITGISSEIIKMMNGNCLMLFTSYKMLGETRELLGDMIDHEIYSQDLSSASEAFDMFVNGENSVLMGTQSYWQGIDLPGDLLRSVIMVKLPFAVPNYPPCEARIEMIREAGGNPFLSYQVPEAVIKFRQGFGRLIRSRSDRGIVAVLDSRILHKSYGRVFLKSLPECRVVYTLDDLARAYSALDGVKASL